MRIDVFGTMALAASGKLPSAGIVPSSSAAFQPPKLAVNNLQQHVPMKPVTKTVHVPVASVESARDPERRNWLDILGVRNSNAANLGNSADKMNIKAEIDSLRRGSMMTLKPAAVAEVEGALARTAVSLARGADNHAVFLLHGLISTPKSMESMEAVLKDFGVQTVKPGVNVEKTFDGIQNGGKRVLEFVKKYLADNPQVKKISFIGHSMGGLYSREAVKLVSEDAELLKRGIVVQNLVTFATPHTGATNPFPKEFTKNFLGEGRFPSLAQVWKMDREDFLLKMEQDSTYKKSLENVKNVAFLGSKEDPYVPLESSLWHPDPPKGITEHVEIIDQSATPLFQKLVAPSRSNTARRFATTAGKDAEMSVPQILAAPFKTSHSQLISHQFSYGSEVLSILKRVFVP